MTRVHNEILQWFVIGVIAFGGGYLITNDHNRAARLKNAECSLVQYLDTTSETAREVQTKETDPQLKAQRDKGLDDLDNLRHTLRTQVHECPEEAKK